MTVMAKGVKSLVQEQPGGRPAWFFLLPIPFLVFGVIRIYWGRCWGDEGWYLMAVRCVLEGKAPYADFMFTQMPLLPYVYAGPMALLGCNLLVARWLSLVFSVVAILLTMDLAHRRGGREGALLAGTLLCLNLNFAFDGCMLRSQPLSLLLVTAAVYFADRAALSLPRAGLSLLMMTLAVASRISLAPALAALGVYLLAVLRGRRLAVLAMGAAAAAALAALAAAFWAGGNMRFGVVTFHDEFYEFPSLTGRRMWDFTVKFLCNEWALMVCLAAAAVIVIRRRFARSPAGSTPADSSIDSYLFMLLAAYLLTTAVHITRPISHAVYQSSILTIPAIVAALVLGPWLREQASRTGAVAILAAMIVLAMPPQEYMVSLEGKGAYGKIEEAAAVIRRLTPAGEPILTLGPELAVESGRPLIGGYEMSIFSCFPAMPDERAEKLKVISRNRLLSDITTGRAKVICLTENHLGIIELAYGKVAVQAILERYAVRGRIPDYGQELTPLLIFDRKVAAGPAGRPGR